MSIKTCEENGHKYDSSEHTQCPYCPDKTEVFFANINSRSFFYDSARIFKFKFLPRKNFIKYEGNIDPSLKDNFKYINYETALKSYDIELLKKKYETKINNYLSRVDIIYENSKKNKF